MHLPPTREKPPEYSFLTSHLSQNHAVSLQFNPQLHRGRPAVPMEAEGTTRMLRRCESYKPPSLCCPLFVNLNHKASTDWICCSNARNALGIPWQWDSIPWKWWNPVCGGEGQHSWGLSSPGYTSPPGDTHITNHDFPTVTNRCRSQSTSRWEHDAEQAAVR